MASAGHKALISHCVALLNTFDPINMAAEQHVAEYLDQQKELEEDDKAFLTEVFSGCVRYSTILSVVMNGFFNRDGKAFLRSTENVYRVICYLALFRLDELGIGHFGKFAKSQDINKMHKFLAFFFNEKHLRTWIKDEWSRLYEQTFVQTKLLSPLLRWITELQELTIQMKKKIDNKMKPRKQTVPVSSVQPFALTQPRPRSIPVPDAIPKLQPHKPVPETTYKEPPEQEFFAKVKESNRRKAEERLMEAAKMQFSCANPEKSAKVKGKIAKIQQDQDDLLRFESHRSNPVPRSILSDNIPIKLNAATILREGNLYAKRDEKTLKQLEALEAGENDGSAFAEWQQKMRKVDMEEELAAIEQRRIQGKLSLEEAILARQNVMHQNRAKVEEMKQEAARLMQLFMEKKLKEEAQVRRMVEGIQDTHENAKEARRRIQEYKAGIVAGIQEESRELMKAALEEAEQEMKQRMELIRQIRAMEAQPVVRFAQVDFSSTAGHGLLNEMSIVELNERLALCKTKQKAEEDATRDEILAGKEAKDQLLMDTLQNISRHRTETSKAAALKFEIRKKTHNVPIRSQDEKVLELQRKLEEKKEQRLREQESAKIRPTTKSHRRTLELNASKKLVEQRRWAELERSREKTTRLGSHGIMSSRSAATIAGRTMVPQSS